MGSTEPLVLAVDLGGTNFRVALVNQSGEIIQRSSRPTSKGEGSDILVRKLAAAMLKLVAESEIPESRIQAVGMGIPGLVEPDKGLVVKAPNIPELDQLNLGQALDPLLPWPVSLENDANLFAWGEAYMGAGRGEKNLLGITLGTGVGGGLVLEGRLWQGSKGTAAEIGHITIEPGGERCNCGNQGCLETLASATWTVKWTVAQLAAGEESSLQPLWRQNSQELTARQIYQEAVAGDRLARKAFQRVGRALGIGIADVVHLLGVSVIILGGNFSRAWDQFIGSLEVELDKRMTFFPKDDLKLRPATLGDNAGLLGAARLAWDLYGKKT
jgi:glucokinase